jgi:hypothetical protein
MIVRRKLLLDSPENTGNTTSSHLVVKQEELAKKIIDLALQSYLCSYFQGFFNMLQNLTTWDQRLYLPSEGRHAADFHQA